METKRNVMLNFLKGFACISVVLIHVPFPGKVGEIVKCTSAYAVPLFFLIAGYFSFGKDEKVIKIRLIKMIKLFCFAVVMFFLFQGSLEIYLHALPEWLAENFNIKALVRMVFFCTIGFAGALWYLIAQIEAYVLWFFVVKYRKENLMVKLIPLLLILYYVIAVVVARKGLDWSVKANFITGCLPWFTLGYYIHQLPKQRVGEIKNIYLLAAFLIGLAMSISSAVFDMRIILYPIGHILYATSLFLVGVKYPENCPIKCIAWIGDKLSLWIYIFHIPTSFFAWQVIKILSRIDTIARIDLWLYPVMTIGLVIVVAYIFDKLFNRSLLRR